MVVGTKCHRRGQIQNQKEMRYQYASTPTKNTANENNRQIPDAMHRIGCICINHNLPRGKRVILAGEGVNKGVVPHSGLSGVEQCILD